MHRFALILIAILMVSACSSSGRTVRNEGGGQSVTLSPLQDQTVREAVKSMITQPDSAQFAGMTAMTFGGEPGVQICGHVKYKDDAGAYGAMQRFYLDLREADGKPAAERGQVASTPPALSKVNFMCRRHGGG